MGLKVFFVGGAASRGESDKIQREISWITRGCAPVNTQELDAHAVIMISTRTRIKLNVTELNIYFNS